MGNYNFTPGQILAMKVIIAIMLERAHDRDFEFSSLGMQWLGAMSAPAVLDEDGGVILVQELFDAALIVAWSAIAHLSAATKMNVDEVIQNFAVSIAAAEVGQDPPGME